MNFPKKKKKKNADEEPGEHIMVRKLNPTVVKTFKIAIVLFVTLILLMMPPAAFGIAGLTVIQQRMIAIFAFAALMWVLEGVPAWVTSVLIIVIMLFTVSDSAISTLINPNLYDAHNVETVMKSGKEVQQLVGIIPYKDIIAAFADPTVMLFMGGFILALVASKSGVDIDIARVMLKPFGTKAHIVLLGIILVTAIFSMFVSNTATAAMMLTFLAPIFKNMPKNERGRIALALAIPIGCNIGGIATPIGTPPNGIARGALIDAGINISFLEWMLIFFPLMLVILLLSWMLLLYLYRFNNKTLKLEIKGGAKKGWKTDAIYIVMLLTIALWCGEKVFGINSYVVALFPVGAFTALGIVTSEDIKTIDWAVLWMVAGGFALGTGMRQSGLAEAMVNSIPFDTFPVLLMIIGAGLLSWLMSTFISNSASAALMVPILITVGEGMKEQLAPLGGVTTLVCGLALCCSFAMALPISTPPNAIAYSTGLVKTNDMAKVGLIVGVVSIVLGYLYLISLGAMGLFNDFNV